MILPEVPRILSENIHLCRMIIIMRKIYLRPAKMKQKIKRIYAFALKQTIIVATVIKLNLQCCKRWKTKQTDLHLVALCSIHFIITPDEIKLINYDRDVRIPYPLNTFFSVYLLLMWLRRATRASGIHSSSKTWNKFQCLPFGICKNI